MVRRCRETRVHPAPIADPAGSRNRLTPHGLTGLVGLVGLGALFSLSGCSATPPPTTAAQTSLAAPSPPLASASPDGATEPAAPDASGDPSDTDLAPSSPAAPPATQTSEAAPTGPSAGARTRDQGGDQAENQAEDEPGSQSSHVIVIDPGTRGGQTSLWQAAVAERKRRATAKKAVASVTNENLHEYQDAELTFAQPKAGKEAAQGAGQGAADAGGSGKDQSAQGDRSEASSAPHDEQYWRHRVLDLRSRMRDAADTIDDLQERVSTLRRRFYAEDDPYVRDGQIKPSWDRALDRLSRERDTVQRLRTELASTLEEGRQEGALPGWLREGIDLEPTFDDDADPGVRRDGDLRIYEPTEPDTIDPEDTRKGDEPSSQEPPP